MNSYRIIISGGGTGGHIFPAIAIAQELKKRNPANEILFVGAQGRMEMEKVPAAGFDIKGLPISGLKRSLSLSNLAVPFKLLHSLKMASDIIDEFKPDIAIGVGGYASAPLLRSAQKKGIPTLIQEQNGFAGLTNKILARKADCICVAYEGMDRFFPADRIVLSGNPVRPGIVRPDAAMRAEGRAYYGLDKDKKVIFIVGGSLGSGTLNEAAKAWIEDGMKGGDDVQLLWQCGKRYKSGTDAFMREQEEKGRDLSNIRYSDFIARMDLAYAAADVVISRSGASTVSELCITGGAVIFVPSPNVAEDHQTHNALALVEKDAALMVKDDQAREKLLPLALELSGDAQRRESLSKNILTLAKADAAATIADKVYGLLGKI